MIYVKYYYSYFNAFIVLILAIAIAGTSEAKLVVVNEKKKIIIIEKKLISLGISSRK